MKSREFVKLSEINLPLDEIMLEDNELIALKGGTSVASVSGRKCHCGCPNPEEGSGSGRKCNCDC